MLTINLMIFSCELGLGQLGYGAVFIRTGASMIFGLFHSKGTSDINGQCSI
jgi:hypothetical protein